MSSTNSSEKLLALVDCNNFFVSCERLFNPKLLKKPVVVLSSNDGCVVSRSDEAKALNIPMGVPFFEIDEIVKRKNVAVFSSNFSLYGDLSRRVMETLEHFHGDVEIYSIDEAFLDLQGVKDPLSHVTFLKEKIFQWTGIPVSIGFGPTKTLAKVATKKAKKTKECFGFFSEREADPLLEEMALQDIWGIGSRTARSLQKRGVTTPLQLKKCEDLWIKKQFSVVLLKTVLELRGVSCLDFEEVESPKKSILTSSSFGRPLHSLEELEEAIATFATKGAYKLRNEKSLASYIQVFVMSSPHKENFYGNQAARTIDEPTDFTPTLIAYAKEALQTIYKPGIAYKRAGVLLWGLVANTAVQQDLFSTGNSASTLKKKKLIKVYDEINEEFGYPILQFGANKGAGKSRATFRSQLFTTSFDNLLTINI